MGIFVSYTTRDLYIDRELLEIVSEKLSEYGGCYIDLLHNDSINKQHHVELMLSKAKHLLLISSISIVESKWVQWEISEAKYRNLPIISVQASSDREKTISNLISKLALEFNEPAKYSKKDSLTHAPSSHPRDQFC